MMDTNTLELRFAALFHSLAGATPNALSPTLLNSAMGFAREARDDARAAWLDGAPPYIRVFDLDYTTAELDQLAAVLRPIHTAPSPYIEQSVRGGTQTETDRQLLFRAEPEIQTVRDKVLAAIREYVAGLPPHVTGHPLLGTARGSIRLSGSWLVRLRAQGPPASMLPYNRLQESGPATSSRPASNECRPAGARLR